MNPICKNQSRRGSHDQGESLGASCNCHQVQGMTAEGRDRGETRPCCPSPSPNPERPLKICVCPTTGGNVQISIMRYQTVDTLRTVISKKLKIAKDRISLLYKERLLTQGTLEDNCLVDGCKVTLLPNVESGLLSPRPDSSVMQALETLSDSQVNAFLTGRSPLTLAMRLGSHVMFVQLQLSTTPPGAASKLPGASSTSKAHASSSARRQQCPAANDEARSSSGSSKMQRPSTSSSSAHRQPHIAKPTPLHPTLSIGGNSRIPSVSASPSEGEAKLNVPPRMSGVDATPVPHSPQPGTLPQTLPVTTSFPSSPLPGQAAPGFPQPETMPEGATGSHRAKTPYGHIPMGAQCPPSPSMPDSPGPGSPTLPFLDSSSLAEAKRNLSLRLKEFSQNATSHMQEETSEPKTSGAIIESMHHLGQGVYSGTFSGTLNPSLQDRNGKPRRSINTIIHILNDLLAARPPTSPRTPQATHPTPQIHPHIWRGESPPQSPVEKNIPRTEENQVIRGKLEHIQMMLEERRRKRQARREMRSSPYTRGGSAHLHTAGCSSENEENVLDTHPDDYDMKEEPNTPS